MAHWWPLPLLLIVLAAAPAAAQQQPASGVLRGSLQGAAGGLRADSPTNASEDAGFNRSEVEAAAAAAEAAAAVAGNATAFWGPPLWPSCRTYGCHSQFVWGHWCGCWPGCRRWGICCSDYAEVCRPHPPHHGGSCAAFGCGPDVPGQSCQCNPRCSKLGNCCSDYRAVCEAPSTTAAPLPPSGPSDAPLYTFYVYRAQSDASYPPKNVNAANLAGVMWYLQHEVVTQSPPKFGITRILRYRVQTKAPERLFAKGMNFGVRYAYDSQKCTGPGRCPPMYAKYGYFVGCNNFASKYPYPTAQTHYTGGIWYSLPGGGACSGPPTGASDCTYSYGWPPQEISLEELVGKKGAAFWQDPESGAANSAKVAAAAKVFAEKYPDSADLATPACDFDYDEFWH